MTTRMQESPFRETAWDQRLDKMLDDLKTTVNPDIDRPSSRRDNSLVSSFRSTSRSDSRNSNRGGVEDGGLMKHHHKEYTSPDKTTRVVTDQFEYESGDPSKYHKKVMKSTYSNYKIAGNLSSDLDSVRQGPDQSVMDAARITTVDNTDNTKGPTSSYSTNSYTSNKATKYSTTELTNGKSGYDEEDDLALINEPPGGEVRKIVWRNRFEKTYETQDGTPTISIEEEARRKREKERLFQKTTTSTLTNYQPQPPQVSPGGQSWADPIPMPTPPQLSPKGEPGVAYVYTYGQQSGGASQVQHLPPLNYVTAAPPASEGAPSPTPSSGTQPIIYHYSYHYTLQPGQSIPEGIPQPPGGHPASLQPPALQVASDTGPSKPSNPPSSTLSYDYKKTSSQAHHATSSRTVDRSDVTNVHHHHHYPPSGGPLDGPGPGPEPRFPNEPLLHDGPKGPGVDPGPNRNISITINKTSSRTTTTKDFPLHGGPTTSTPFPTPGRSRSSSPDRYPKPGGPRTGPQGTVTHITRTSYSDSLDRMRKPPHEGLPFPDTSPIRPKDDNKIPKRVDDLMTSLSDSEDGPTRGVLIDREPHRPKAPSQEREPLISTKISSENTEVSLSERNATDIKKQETKNVAGPPVYYPPGHHQLFDESMHTMTLKENKRRGMAKWRMEKASGYKESSSSSESKGGMAMVPVCLPLCCGAACAIM